MAKKMNGISIADKSPNLEHNNRIIESDMDKANVFVENFAKVSSDENYSPNFIIQREQIARQTADFLRKPVGKILEDSNELNDKFLTMS